MLSTMERSIRRAEIPSKARNQPPSPSIGMWPMRRPVFWPVCVRIISSSVNSVPSNSTTSARAKRSRIAGVTAAPRARTPCVLPRAYNSIPTFAAVSVSSSGALAFEIKREFARDHEQPRLDITRNVNRSPGLIARRDIEVHRTEYRVGGDRRMTCRRRIQREGRALAQGQQSGDLVDLATGQHHGVDRAAAQSALRIQRRRRSDLRRQIRGRVDQCPAPVAAKLRCRFACAV